jgi:hypothetical protein
MNLSKEGNLFFSATEHSAMVTNEVSHDRSFISLTPQLSARLQSDSAIVELRENLFLIKTVAQLLYYPSYPLWKSIPHIPPSEKGGKGGFEEYIYPCK